MTLKPADGRELDCPNYVLTLRNQITDDLNLFELFGYFFVISEGFFRFCQIFFIFAKNAYPWIYIRRISILTISEHIRKKYPK